MKITKSQEQIVLNALTDSYLAIENELLGVKFLLGNKQNE